MMGLCDNHQKNHMLIIVHVKIGDVSGDIMAFKGPRSYRDGPWHYCSRCTKKTHISEMIWQRGLLLGPECVDYGNDGFPLIGQREAAIAAVFEQPTTELMPVPKLTDSSEISSSMDEELIW